MIALSSVAFKSVVRVDLAKFSQALFSRACVLGRFADGFFLSGHLGTEVVLGGDRTGEFSLERF